MAVHRINVAGIIAIEFVDPQTAVTAPDGSSASMPSDKPYVIPDNITEIICDPGGKVRAMTVGHWHTGNGGELLQGFVMNKVLTSTLV